MSDTDARALSPSLLTGGLGANASIPDSIRRFRRSVERAIAGLAVTAFLALVSTGEVPAVVTVTVLALMAAVIFARKAIVAFLNLAGPTVLSVVVFIGCALLSLGGFVIEGPLLLVLWLLLLRMAIPLRPRDLAQAIVLTFIMVVGASALTESVEFAVPFFAYCAMLVVATTIFTTYRAFLLAHPEAAPGRPAKKAPTAHAPRRPAHIRRHWLATSIALIAICITLFLLIPRFSAPGMWLSSMRAEEEQQMSGFDEEVQFGDLTNIGLDRTLVMRVSRMSGPPIDHVRLRGTALDYFGDGTWRRTTEFRTTGGFYEQYNALFDRLMIAYSQQRRRTAGLERASAARGDDEPKWLIEIELNRTNFLFVPYALSFIEWYHDSELQYIGADPISGAIRLNEREHPAKLRYVAGLRPLSHVDHYGEMFVDGVPTLYERAQERAAEDNDFRQRQFVERIERIRAINTQLPRQIQQDPRVAAFARELIGDETDRLEIARILERALQTRFTYSLTSSVSDRSQIVQEFLFDSKQGHCEHFATAMAMLLRSIDIPARIVNGYYSDEFNPVNDGFIVRESNAHSWVEVWFEEVGWLPYDPTPENGRGTRKDERNLVERWFSHLYDSSKTLWYRYVIDFSYWRQREMFGSLYGILDARNYTASGVMRFLTRRTGGRRGQVTLSPGGVGVALLALLAVAWVGAKILLRLQRRLRWRPTIRRARGPGETRWEPSRLIRMVRAETARRFGREQDWSARSLREIMQRWSEEGLDDDVAIRARDIFERWRYSPAAAAAPSASDDEVGSLAQELRRAFRGLPRRL